MVSGSSQSVHNKWVNHFLKVMAINVVMTWYSRKRKIGQCHFLDTSHQLYFYFWFEICRPGRVHKIVQMLSLVCGCVGCVGIMGIWHIALAATSAIIIRRNMQHCSNNNNNWSAEVTHLDAIMYNSWIISALSSFRARYNRHLGIVKSMPHETNNCLVFVFLSFSAALCQWAKEECKYYCYNADQFTRSFHN